MAYAKFSNGFFYSFNVEVSGLRGFLRSPLDRRVGRSRYAEKILSAADIEFNLHL